MLFRSTCSLEFHQKLRQAFLGLADQEPDRCIVIDATRPREQVADEIWRIVNERFDPATAPIQLEGAV